MKLVNIITFIWPISLMTILGKNLIFNIFKPPLPPTLIWAYFGRQFAEVQII